jgi:hypothetical protein
VRGQVDGRTPTHELLDPRERLPRAVELSLTAEGTRAARRVTEAEQRLHAELAERLGERDVAATVRAMRKLVAGCPSGDAIARRRG